MRKRGYLIASLAMLLLLVLSGCKGNKLPDGMDEDKVSRCAKMCARRRAPTTLNR